MNNIYDNGEILIGELEKIKEYINSIEEDDTFIEYIEDLKEDLNNTDLEDDTIVAINYGNNNTYSIDYWDKTDIVKCKNQKVLKKYAEVEKFRNKIRSDITLMESYFKLKEVNKNDDMYGWVFEDNNILVETLEDLEDYSSVYTYSVLSEYEDILYSICKEV